LIKNLTSRKFILAAVGCLTGILGIVGCNDNIIAVAAFIALEVLCILAYIITEGKIDAASLTAATNVAIQAAEMIDQIKSDENAEVAVPEHTDLTQTVLSGALDSDAVGTTNTVTDDGAVKTIGEDGKTTYFL
jgi:hypothetical protein